MIRVASLMARPVRLLAAALAACIGRPFAAVAGPQGPTVKQGAATVTTQGAVTTIRTSDRALINWQSFNIGVGETTRFVQPSSSSLVWNRINDPNPSQLLGRLQANGYVVLQNSSGFFIGGQASIMTKGLMLTTAPLPMPDLVGGGSWQFTALPPSASIINYGQIMVERGGSVFVIAHNIENHGTISAPEGNIGLYAGKEVLVSERPDGRGLSARVTLPEGSVNNSGNLMADAGRIAMHAQVVNQGGLVQANSVRSVNGTIELIASDSVNLGSASIISARGDATGGASAGGAITIKSGGTFSDQPGSTIDVAGGAQGGRGGQVEISAARLAGIQSKIDAHAAAGFLGGELLIDPYDLDLDGFFVSSLTPLLDAGLYKLTLEADHDINFSTAWVLANPGGPALLSLTAGNSIVLNNGSRITAGDNWSVSLSAGAIDAASKPDDGAGGIYLNGNASIQTRNGNINLWAANEVLVNSDPTTAGNNGIRTVNGGSISVTTLFGDVNSGANRNGYQFNQRVDPYYRVAPNLGGISTAAGGNVTIDAGGNVTSYFPLAGNQNILTEAGIGAYGAAPGNVSVKAGGSVFGHYVLANGTGHIQAGVDVGGASASQGVALSLTKGAWTVDAPNGSIYLQEVRNPNGVFNNTSGPTFAGYHLFDYDPMASVTLNGGKSVEITGAGIPRTDDSIGALPMIFPPSLTVKAGSGGFTLDQNVTLFPSGAGNLKITTEHGGDFVGLLDFTGVAPYLAMSDSGLHQWLNDTSFGLGDHGLGPLQLNNPNPVEISVAGSVRNMNLYTNKRTTMNVDGDVINSSFVGANLHATDVTSINVKGRIYNRPGYTFVDLSERIVSVDPEVPAAWDLIFSRAVDPALVAGHLVRSDVTAAELRALALEVRLFPGAANPGFVYNAATKRLGFSGPMSQSVLTVMKGPFFVLRYGRLDGLPVVENGHLVIDPVSFVPADLIENLFHASQDVPRVAPTGYQIGGPGRFNINAASLDLGNTLGILSWGIGGPLGDTHRYGSLAGTVDGTPNGARITDVGAAINVTLSGNLDMFTSTIASVFGGDVSVTSTGGELNLGSQELLGGGRFAFGIYTSGHSDVHVTAAGDVNVAGSRIATYNGGDVFVKSLTGDVNAGSGGNTYVNVQLVSRNRSSGEPLTTENPIYGSGIVAVSLPRKLQTPGGNPLPGDITVETPRGNIISSKAGILQLALDGSVAGGPKVTLTAGTPASGGSPAIPGNIDLGDSGVIGGTVNLTAQGDIRGLIISRQNSTINAAQNFVGTLLSAGTANVAAGGNVSGTIIGVGGVSASGGQGVTAALLSQNVSVAGGQAQSTLGTTANATATSQAASQQANTETKEKTQVETAKNDEDELKKNRGPVLTRRGRVTVILPKAL